MENNVNSIKGNNPIVVAMSGGVDSSVAAALMNKDYEDVIGVTLRLYDEKKVANSKTCCSGADIMDAKKIANTITIPHYIFDYEEIFRKNVIEPFISEYKSRFIFANKRLNNIFSKNFLIVKNVMWYCYSVCYFFCIHYIRTRTTCFRVCNFFFII